MKAITTKYHGPTDFKGSRVSASDGDGNRVTIGYRSEHNSDQNHRSAAIALCHKMGWDGTLAEGGVKGGNVYVFIDHRLSSFDIPSKAALSPAAMRDVYNAARKAAS